MRNLLVRISVSCVGVLALGVTAGCATAQSAAPPTSTVAAADVELPLHLPAPVGAEQASLYLETAIGALRENEPDVAVRLLKALARSDHLTDRGRANVYWLLAEAERQEGNSQGMVDALGGFLVAATVIDDADVTSRVEEAEIAFDVAKTMADKDRNP